MIRINDVLPPSNDIVNAYGEPAITFNTIFCWT